jgi:CheY-like chemotaxis protein
MEKGKVLIVEDNDDTREMMAELLCFAGYRVEEARNGLEAYQMLCSCDEQPGLVLLDLMMPVMSGPELVDALAADPKLRALPIVVVSAAMETISTGAVRRALRKPVTCEQLLQVVDECCATNDASAPIPPGPPPTPKLPAVPVLPALPAIPPPGPPLSSEPAAPSSAESPLPGP